MSIVLSRTLRFGVVAFYRRVMVMDDEISVIMRDQDGSGQSIVFRLALP